MLQKVQTDIIFLLQKVQIKSIIGWKTKFVFFYFYPLYIYFHYIDWKTNQLKILYVYLSLANHVVNVSFLVYTTELFVTDFLLLCHISP